MAKRKAAAGRKRASRKGRTAARKSAARKKTAVVRKAGAGKARRARKAGGAARAAKARKPRKSAMRKATSVRKAAGVRRAAGIRRAGATRKPAAPKAVARKAPGLDRERRIVRDDDIVPTPPSSLDLDRTASAARSGRRHVHDRLNEYHETSPALTGGDVDADWESAASVGDEAPGGDNPTPDQDVVDDIGRAVGVQYDDNEELKGEAKISKRDKHRWELDPASSEDYDDR